MSDISPVPLILQIAQQSSTSYLQKFASSSVSQLPSAQAIQQRFLAPHSKASLADSLKASNSAASNGSSAARNKAEPNDGSFQALQLPLLRPVPSRLSPLPGAAQHPAQTDRQNL